jgi:hypothetical protein
MTTSNSTLWELNRNQLIEAAMRKLGVLAKGQTPDAEDYTNGTIALNAVVAELQTIGMPLWARTEYTFPLVAAQATYTIGVGQALNVPFPLKLQQAVLVNTSSNATLDMAIISIYEYNGLSPLNSSGTPVQICYQPQINLGTITVWPTPDASAALNQTVKLVFQAPFDDFVAAGDTPDFPKEWHQTIIYKLAEALAPEYGIPIGDQGMIVQMADKHLTTALSFGTDESSVFFQPDRRD